MRAKIFHLFNNTLHHLIVYCNGILLYLVNTLMCRYTPQKYYTLITIRLFKYQCLTAIKFERMVYLLPGRRIQYVFRRRNHFKMRAKIFHLFNNTLHYSIVYCNGTYFVVLIYKTHSKASSTLSNTEVMISIKLLFVK